MAHPRIEVLLDEASMSPEATRALAEIDADIHLSFWSAAPLARAELPSQARLLFTSDARKLTNGKLNHFLRIFDRNPCDTLVISDHDVSQQHLRRVGRRPIQFVSSPTQATLIKMLRGICTEAATHPTLPAAKEATTSGNRPPAWRLKTLEAGLEELEEQMADASRLQMELLVTDMPQVAGARLSMLFEPADLLSGDAYEVSRLDGTRVGISLADATGHGLPAAFLSVYIKHLLRAKELRKGQFRILEPNDVLQNLNREIVDSALEDCQFVAALCALYDEKSRVLRWSRAGTPYPVLVRGKQHPEPLLSKGCLAGAMVAPTFEVIETQLEPGDRVFFFTDGLEALLLGKHTSTSGGRLEATSWYRRLPEWSVPELMDTLQLKLEQAIDGKWEADDVTVLALEIN